MYNEQFTQIWMRAKLNFHRLLITIEKEKWHGPLSFLIPFVSRFGFNRTNIGQYSVTYVAFPGHVCFITILHLRLTSVPYHLNAKIITMLLCRYQTWKLHQTRANTFPWSNIYHTLSWTIRGWNKRRGSAYCTTCCYVMGRVAISRLDHCSFIADNRSTLQSGQYGQLQS